MKYFIIYNTKCLLNTRTYTGKHEQQNFSGVDKYPGSGLLLTRAIKKYGRENFERRNVAYYNTFEEMNLMENWWIETLSSSAIKYPNLGYNLAPGGQGGKLYERTEEHRKNQSEWGKKYRLGKNNPNYGNKWTDKQKKRGSERNKGKKLSEETKSKISRWNKINGNPFKDKHHSKEQCEKWSKMRKGTRCKEENPFYKKTHTDERKKIIGLQSKLRTKYIYFFIDPYNNKYFNVKNLTNFCEEHGLKRSCLYFNKFKWTRYKKWTIRKELK